MKIELLEYREQKHLTLAVLSKMTGLGTGRLSEIETGVTSDPRISTLIKIADALDVTLDELVGRGDGWNLTQGICVAGAWMIKNHNEEAMVVDMLASMQITKELMQQEHVAEEDYEILSEAIDSNWGRYVRQLPENI
ncbi:helix-turn-helix transcriptional regulator [Solobacterium moorei]|uniref:helix-turn-helix domain-containing protein n=1 Tax=Solobacterium moorei TaxID=102148 RepID=UPI0024AE5F7E|nr:helix-turn-helix transcriptional regulator [Solobacterium moorei]MDI6415718.1 helix-turn-helix transcriptional regulator [Solobacterium moorei]